MSLLIKKEGILTTVQDSGRFGFRQYGINPNGVMDTTAARLINILLGNDDGEAVLEMHFPAADLEFQADCAFAIGGADFEAQMDRTKKENWRIHKGVKGAVLNFKKKVSGNRVYFAVKGGFDIPDWLSSKSTNLTAAVGGIGGRRIMKGDVIEFREPQTDREIPKCLISRSLIPRYGNFPTVRSIRGAEFETLTDASQEDLAAATFVISHQSNRMGYRLNGTPLHRRAEKNLLSSAVDFGTVQLLPDGQLIILMADHQTTGGYPRIAHVISSDLPLLAQLGENDKVAFHFVTVEKAESISVAFERELKLLRLGRELNYCV